MKRAGEVLIPFPIPSFKDVAVVPTVFMRLMPFVRTSVTRSTYERNNVSLKID